MSFVMLVEVSICNVRAFRNRGKRLKLDYREFRSRDSNRKRQEPRRRSDIFCFKLCF